MLRKWWNLILSDEVVQRVGRNASYLVSANVLVALLGLLSLGIMARALGPAGLGVIALIEAYARLVERILHFEPWQSVIRYGTEALESGEHEAFRRLIKAALLVDLCGGSLAAFVAILGAKFAAGWIGLDAEHATMAMWFASTLVVGLSSTATAILRLFDYFKLIGKTLVGLACMRLCLMVIAWQYGADLWAFVIALIVNQILAQLTPLLFAWRELRRLGHGTFCTTPLQGLLAEHSGLFRFIWNTNINVLARASTLRFDTLLLGAVLDPSATGLYQLSKRLGLVALRLGRVVQQAIYPDVARLWARGEIRRFRRIVLQINGAMGVAGGFCLLGVMWQAEPLVTLLFGESFVGSAPSLIVWVLAVTILLAGNTLNAAILSMGADRILLHITLFATFCFFVAFVPLVHFLGPVGASFSHVAFNAVWLGGSLWIFLRRTKAAASRPAVMASE